MNDEMTPFQGEKCAWVTGAARGIGRAVAVELARCGFSVWATDVDELGLNATSKEVALAGGKCITKICDVTTPNSVDSITAEILGEAEHLDVLVNNAGLIHTDGFLELSFETWRQVMSVNADGTFLVGQAVARRMVRQPIHTTLERRGLIINVGSSAAEFGRPQRAAYGASKAVVKHLTMTEAVFLRSSDVGAVVLYPGQVVDGMLRRVIDDTALMESRSVADVEEEMTRTLPSGHFQSAEEVGQAAAFLALSVGMEMTGKVLWSDAHLQVL